MEPPVIKANKSNETPDEQTRCDEKRRPSKPIATKVSPIIWLHQNASGTLINNRTTCISNRPNSCACPHRHHSIQQSQDAYNKKIAGLNSAHGSRPNDQKLSHAAGDFRQPKTRSEN
jgi:hypothetical protein